MRVSALGFATQSERIRAMEAEDERLWAQADASAGQQPILAGITAWLREHRTAVYVASAALLALALLGRRS